MRTQLRHLLFSTKPVSKAAFYSVLLTAITLALVFVGAEFFKLPSLATAPNKSEARNSKQLAGDASHTLAAAYYSVSENLKATLMLSNQGPNQMPVQISLFSSNGFQSDLPAITLNGNEVRAIDLGQHINLGSSFEEGSVRVVYQGRRLELGGVVTLADSARSLIFDEELTEPAKAFASSRLEGVWWRPTGSAHIKLAFSNISDSPLSVTVQTRGEWQGNSDSTTFILGAHETRVLNTENHKAGSDLDLHGVAGGISISHSGAPGNLIAYGHIQEPAKGFSNVIDFTDPQTIKTARLDGAGLRFGTVSGQRLSQIAIVRNVGAAPTIVEGRIPYTLANGEQGVASLPTFQLAPGEVKQVYLPAISQSAQAPAAGLEFNYTGSPGSVIASALSMSSNRSHVFRVPLRDAQVQFSSTGYYPWSIDDNSSTIVYIKNTTDSPKQFTMYVKFDGGDYALGVNTISAGQTLTFDVRSIRDSQKPDTNGLVIPLSAAHGKVIWAVQGPETKPLIGRIEQSDVTNGVSMTAACGVCCPPSYFDSFITPDIAVGLVGDFSQFFLFRQDMDCFGVLLPPYPYHNSANWFCDNTSVATINSSGLATAVGIGTSFIFNPFTPLIYSPGISECIVSDTAAHPEAECEVVDPQACPIPRNFRQDGNAQTSGMDMVIDYKWDSSTGNLADLSNVTIGERVDYPARNCGGNLKYCWPSPPWALTAVTDQPTIIDLPGATPGIFHDTHESKTFRTPYQARGFSAAQVYRYRTSCAANNRPVELVKYTIQREVVQEGGQWKYRITKGSNVKTFNLP